MYDAGKIVTGLLIFLLLITFPVWYNAAMGKAQTRPNPVVQTADEPGRDTCVLEGDEMVTAHMNLLDEWRDTVVRDGVRMTETFNGHEIEMSLSRTCMDCHSNKEQFCDECHTYMDVEPYCWECHVAPRLAPEAAPEMEGGEQ